MQNDNLTTPDLLVVNQDLDDHFTEIYGKQNFLDRYELDKSNWQKAISGNGRKVPRVYFDLMNAQQKVIALEDALKLCNSKIDIEKLLELIQRKDDKEKEELRIENDRLKSCLRMVGTAHKTLGKVIEKSGAQYAKIAVQSEK